MEQTVIEQSTIADTFLSVLGYSAIAIILVLVFFLAAIFRRVVPTNMVHIVQSSKSTTSYGRGKDAGNTYYAIPSWVPKFGVTVIELPESIFSVELMDYDAYDAARLPFMVDITAFFRIDDSEEAAQRVSSFSELKAHLENAVQGAVRRILATNTLEDIMEARGTLGNQFTEEVKTQVAEWGVTTVKTIEFMDLRDSKSSQVIHNIMEKEKSRIDMESRMARANNNMLATNKETETKRDADLARQEAEQQVGIRTAQKEQQVGIAKEQSQQEIAVQAKTTAERNMEVKQVNDTRTAEIQKEVAIVNAQQQQQEAVIKAQADKTVQVTAAEAAKEVQVLAAAATKESTVVTAEGDLLAAQMNAQGIQAEGMAKGAAEQAILMAPVETQIKLAQEIGTNEGYQQYLVTVEQIKASQAVGIAMAGAIEKADLKIISSGSSDGNIASGVAGLGDLFSAGGGTKLSGMLSALAASDEGKALINGFTSRLNGEAAAKSAK